MVFAPEMFQVSPSQETVLAVALLLVYEHWIVRPDDLTRVNVAFFNVNGYISLEIFFCTLADVLVFRSGL